MNGDETLKPFEAGKKTKLHFYEGKIWLFFLSLASVEIVEKMVAALEENET